MTSQHISIPTTRLSPTGIRRLLSAGTALGVVVLASALVWLLAPSLGPYETLLVPAHHLVEDGQTGSRVLAAAQAALGVMTTTAGLLALYGRPPAALIGWIGLAAGVAMGLGFVGFNGLAAAGYTLALALPVTLITTVVVLAVKRPGIGIPIALATIGGITYALFGPLSVVRFYGLVLEQAAVDVPKFTAPLVFILFAGIWALLGAQLLRRRDGALGRFVLRYRVPITIASSVCALPYVIARISWLTPWPLFGGDATESPEALATGLMLGAAMLTGAILNIGLVLPWGETFPRWFPRIGGRSVPEALAVVPAAIVAALFTAAGFESILALFADVGGMPVDQLLLILVLPFWLWGPLLGAATWGYAQHRVLTAASGAS
ncbi:MAG TPA: hypothetical protein H9830_00505 [Candidatus Agrococcus pullicola]|uniref:Uncharacterized protein n=1 Tax=Candidatus Agrococcus pullicola TaxID=2838429 RepID=A0A9D1YRZ0_9MICO|nr:hypothetical protein [Candidatus Agrococcus pullicola]